MSMVDELTIRTPKRFGMTNFYQPTESRQKAGPSCSMYSSNKTPYSFFGKWTGSVKRTVFTCLISITCFYHELKLASKPIFEAIF